eukprot:3827326-Amphidinium_carterae.3
MKQPMFIRTTISATRFTPRSRGQPLAVERRSRPTAPASQVGKNCRVLPLAFHLSSNNVHRAPPAGPAMELSSSAKRGVQSTPGGVLRKCLHKGR